MNVLEAIDREGEVTRISAQGRIAIQEGDTVSSARLFQQAAELLEASVADLKKPSERDLARFLAASHYYYGGHYAQAAKVCERIQEKRLPSRVRHIYPPFLKNVRERSAPDYVSRYTGRLDGYYQRARNGGDPSAAQEVIEILMEHSYLLPHDQMAYVRATCAEVLGRQRAASLFYRNAWRFNPEHPNYLSFYLDSLCKEGRDAEAWAIVEEQLADDPGVGSSLNAMHVLNARLTRGGQADGVVDQQEVNQQRIELIKHFESALESFRSLTSTERMKISPWMEYAFMIVFVAYEASKDATNQLETLYRWIELRPDSPYPRVLRGIMTYPGDAADTDFRDAIRLQSPDPLPYYYLAYQALGSRNFHECDRLSTLALQRNPEADIRASILSWQAISRWNLGLDRPQQIRKLFDEARQLKPDDPVIASYAEAFDDHPETPHVSSALPLEGEEHRRERVRQYADELQRKSIEGMNPIFSAA
ncbi:MAG: hypothetical protein ACLQGP_02480 [Isosphaeraceae bacterium]